MGIDNLDDLKPGDSDDEDLAPDAHEPGDTEFPSRFEGLVTPAEDVQSDYIDKKGLTQHKDLT